MLPPRSCPSPLFAGSPLFSSQPASQLRVTRQSYHPIHFSGGRFDTSRTVWGRIYRFVVLLCIHQHMEDQPLSEPVRYTGVGHGCLLSRLKSPRMYNDPQHSRAS